jgi:hypothetical protein
LCTCCRGEDHGRDYCQENRGYSHCGSHQASNLAASLIEFAAVLLPLVLGNALESEGNWDKSRLTGNPQVEPSVFCAGI